MQNKLIKNENDFIETPLIIHWMLLKSPWPLFLQAEKGRPVYGSVFKDDMDMLTQRR